jgi:hypothetical protein
MKKKGEARKIIKLILLYIAGFVAMYIAFNYLTNNQLIWAAIAILFILHTVTCSGIENRIKSIASKLDVTVDDLKSDIGYDPIHYLGMGNIRPKHVDCDTLETKDITTGNIYIADCIRIMRKGNTPYLVIKEWGDEDQTVIGIDELKELIDFLKQNELNLGNITEEEFIIKEIAKREKYIKESEEYKKNKGDKYIIPDEEIENDIKRKEREIAELKKWLEELPGNLY